MLREEENSNYEDFRKQTKERLDDAEDAHIFSKDRAKRRLFFWGVRLIIFLAFLFLFWDYSWIKWVIIVYLPLSILNLLAIYFWPVYLRRKITTARQKASEIRPLREEK